MRSGIRLQMQKVIKPSSFPHGLWATARQWFDSSSLDKAGCEGYLASPLHKSPASFTAKQELAIRGG